MAAEITVPNEKNEQKEEECRWSNIPCELVCLIASRAFKLDPGTIPTIPRVCRSWRLNLMQTISQPLPPPPEHHKLLYEYPYLTKMLYEYPYLMSLKGCVCKFYHPICNQYSFTMELPELEGAYIRYSKFGWLLLSRMDDTHFFFNPFTRNKVELPARKGLTGMVFTCPPTSRHCCVFGIYEWSKHCLLKRGESDWSSCKFFEGFGTKNCHPVHYNHRFYFLGNKGNLGVTDCRKNFNSMMGNYFLKSRKGVTLWLHRCFLMENGGELLVVCMDNEEQHIYMKAMNPLKEKVWRSVDSLRNKMIYISRSASFVKPAPARSMSNKICFPRVQDNNCIFYSLDAQKFQSFSGDYSSKSPWNVKEFMNCTWIELMPSSSSNNQEINW